MTLTLILVAVLVAGAIAAAAGVFNAPRRTRRRVVVDAPVHEVHEVREVLVERTVPTVTPTVTHTVTERRIVDDH